MKIFDIILLLLMVISCNAQEVSLKEQYWIPNNINWIEHKTSGGSQIRKADFKTIYFKNDSVFYILSSYQSIDLDSDSLAYAVEPGYNIYKGLYNVRKSKLYVEYKQTYGSFFFSKELKKDIVLFERNLLIFNDIKFKKTDGYSKYSKDVINSHILMSEKQNK